MTKPLYLDEEQKKLIVSALSLLDEDQEIADLIDLVWNPPNYTKPKGLPPLKNERNQFILELVAECLATDKWKKLEGSQYLEFKGDILLTDREVELVKDGLFDYEASNADSL